MLKYEKRFVAFLEKNYLFVGFIFFNIISIILRKAMFSFESGDYVCYIKPWSDQLRESGGFAGIASYDGNYNMPYVTILALLTYLKTPILTSVKVLSCSFDFALALATAYMVAELVEKHKKEFFILTYGAVLLLPSVLLNSALWAQCDSIYVSFMILSVVFLLKEKYFRSFIFLGIAFSLKLQTILILPIFVVLYVTKKDFSIINFLIVPIIDLLMSVPALIAGKSMYDIVHVYTEQAKVYEDKMVLNFPNIYNLLNCPPDMFYKISAIVVVGICAIMLGYVIFKKVEWTNEKILNLTLWFVIMETFLLPGMHDRYMYFGEILALVILLVYRKNLPITLFVIGVTFITYSAFLFGNTYNYMALLSGIYFALIIYFTRDVLKLLGDENKEKKEIAEKA